MHTTGSKARQAKVEFDQRVDSSRDAIIDGANRRLELLVHKRVQADDPRT